MRMSPGVRRNLMSFIICSFDSRGPRKSGVVNLSLTVVVTRDEKGGFGIVLLQHVQDMLGVDVRTVIVSNGNGSSHCAIIDSSSTIQNITELGSRNSRSASARWNLVVVASRCEVELTSRCRTVVRAFATPAWSTLVSDNKVFFSHRY